MEIQKISNNLPNSNYSSFLIDVNYRMFCNDDCILKLNTLQILKFFKDELTIKYVGKGYTSIDYANAQSNKPINPNNPIFYFEVLIIDEGSKKDITIGFSDKDFILNKQCGSTSKSFGYNGDGKIYHDKTKGDAFGPKFKQKDVIGCGYYFSKNSIFYTLNGKFIGWAFKNVEFQNYYATVSLHSLNEKVKVNFGKTHFIFDVEGFYLSQTNEKINSILSEQIEIKDLDYIVREYLVHSGYQESFMTVDMISNPQELDHKISNGNDAVVNQKENCGLSWRNSNDLYIANEPYERRNSLNKNDMMDENFIDSEKLRKYSTDEGIMREGELRKRTLSLMIDRMDDESDKNPDIFLIMNFLKERKILQNMLKEKDYETALKYFEMNFQEYKQKKEISFRKIIICLTTLKYLEFLKINDYMSAYQILNKLEKSYWNKDVTLSMYDKEDKIIDYTLDVISVLLCYQNVSTSELAYFFLDKQLSLILDQINSLILELAGVASESILERIVKQQTLTSYLYKTLKHCQGEKISIKI